MKQPYKKPRIHTGELRTMVRFYEFEPNPGPEPGETFKRVLYEAWAKVEEVYFRDLEQAKANGTVSDLTIYILDTKGEFVPHPKHYLEVDAPEYQDRVYNIRDVQPDLQNRDFTKIVAGVTD